MFQRRSFELERTERGDEIRVGFLGVIAVMNHVAIPWIGNGKGGRG